MKLSHLLQDCFSLTLSQDPEITRLALDSRSVQSGDLFFALPGTKTHGEEFIDEAISKGAIAILMDVKEKTLHWKGSIPLIAIPDLKTKVSELAARFYDYPAKKIRTAGFTGTSGKTSCTQFMGQALHELNQSCGIIGTLGNGLYAHLIDSQLTTPDAITVQKWLHDFVKQGADVVAMEVSSHSLDQGRVKGIPFDVGVFTNLTRDHLDYHGTMENYGAAKKQLFTQTKRAVVNADDAFGQDILKSLPSSLETIIAYSIEKNYFYSHQNDCLHVYADQCRFDHAGIYAKLITPWGEGELFSSLVGQFNLSNLLAVLATLCLLDVPFKTALNCLSKVMPAAGRMQFFHARQKPLVVVDYAHKPDALEKVLIALRQQCQGKLYCVFGCGGERDRGKRPMMARIAEQYADQVILTNDNPRHEDPKQIVADIMQGFTDKTRIIVQHDRSKAIQDVIQYAKPSDYILIAGKGAETYQIIGDEKIPFNDLVIVKEIIK